MKGDVNETIELGLSNAAMYRITVRCLLNDEWSSSFDQFQVRNDLTEKSATLTGLIRDQSQLMGILNHINGMAIPILHVECLSVQE